MQKLDKIPTRAPKGIDRDKTKELTCKLIEELAVLQNLMFAEHKHKMLIIFQGMDASGKDGAMKGIFKGLNPLGCRVKAFKAPTQEELSHDFLWRIHQHVPCNGMIQIFNRSHYEDILVPTVHKLLPESELKKRYEHINNFEALLAESGVIIFKFYLHISHKEQVDRLKQRISNPEKNWKYSENDLKESKKWNEYMKVYENIFKHCGKEHKWMIVPAEQNWYRDYLIIKTVVEKLKTLKMKFPGLPKSVKNKG